MISQMVREMFQEATGKLPDWKRGQKQWAENIGMRSEALRVTDATRLVERRKTGDELTSVIVCISQVIFGAKKGFKMSGCALRMLETMIVSVQGQNFRTSYRGRYE